jgi:WD40 repeat protein
VPSGKKLGGFTASDVYFSHVFSKDGTRLYVGQSGMISVLDPLSGEKINAFFEHDSSAMGILLSPDGTTMLSNSSDGTVIFRRLEE